MATDVTVRNIPPFIRWVMITTALAIGAGYLFGPDSLSSNTSFTYAKSLMPIEFWGALFMIAGILMIITRLVGHGLGVIFWGTWSFALMVAYADGLGTSWGGLMYPIGFAATNGYEVFRWGQKRALRFRPDRTRLSGER